MHVTNSIYATGGRRFCSKCGAHHQQTPPYCGAADNPFHHESSIEESAYIVLTQSIVNRNPIAQSAMSYTRQSNRLQRFDSGDSMGHWSMLDSVMNMQQSGMYRTVRRQQNLDSLKKSNTLQPDDFICSRCFSDTIELIEGEANDCLGQTLMYRNYLLEQNHTRSATYECKQDENGEAIDAAFKYEVSELSTVEEIEKLTQHRAIVLSELAEVQEEISKLKKSNKSLALEIQHISSKEEARLELLRSEAEQNEIREEMASTLHQIKKVCASADIVNSGPSALEQMFEINHTDLYPSINGLRVARYAQGNLDWEEINEGVGQTVLLLQCLSNLTGFSPPTHRLVPLGPCSRLLLLGPGGSPEGCLALYCTGGAAAAAAAFGRALEALGAYLSALAGAAAAARRRGGGGAATSQEAALRGLARRAPAPPAAASGGAWADWLLRLYVRLQQLLLALER